MPRKGKLGIIAGLALLLVLPALARAEIYVEGFLGGTAASNMGSASFHQKDVPPPPEHFFIPNDNPIVPGSFLNMNNSGSVSPAFILGGRVGTWFVPTGALALPYPDWMKYFGFYTDLSYQQLKVNSELTQVSDHNDAGVLQTNFAGEFHGSGYVWTWAFMLAGRYGFLPSDKVPFGRLQPWAGIGPAVLFTGMRPKATVLNSEGGLGAQANPGWRSTVAPALVMDAGLRYMIGPKFSIDLSFRYRYAQPNFHFNFTDMNGGASRLNFSTTYNLFSGMAGIAYHF